MSWWIAAVLLIIAGIYFGNSLLQTFGWAMLIVPLILVVAVLLIIVLAIVISR